MKSYKKNIESGRNLTNSFIFSVFAREVPAAIEENRVSMTSLAQSYLGTRLKV